MIQYTNQIQLNNYLPIPRSVLTMDLPSTAVLLYGLLLDRATLSKKHGYSDAGGWLYALFPQECLCEALNISPSMIKRHLALLEEKRLIHRVRRQRKQANRYYLLVPPDAVKENYKDTGTATLCTGEGYKSVRQRAHKVAPNNLNYQTNIINAYQYGEGESL